MNIALISPTNKFVDYVKSISLCDAIQAICPDFTTPSSLNDYEFSVVFVDKALLDQHGVRQLQQFCSLKKQHQTFIIVLSLTDIVSHEAQALYDAGVITVFNVNEPVEVARSRVARYLSYFQKNRQWEESNQYTLKQHERLTFYASHDALTGIYNHRFFQEKIAEKVLQHEESCEPLGLLMLDIDFFKEVNDSYGHQVGDVVLKEFAKLVGEELGPGQIWARYGGEEFMLILPGLTKAEIQDLAQNIRLKTERFVFCENRSGLKVTVSLGGTMLGENADNVSVLIEQADQALYQAKAQGRNRTIWFEPSRCADSSGPLSLADNLACVRDRLRATLEKTRASALASFEAMVHSQTKDHIMLQARNKLALQMVNLLCKRLNLPRGISQSFRRAFKLHDLLRLFISDSTIEKTGSLSEAEMLALEDQPLMLKQLTDLFDFFADERVILRYHHEYFDGSGYPEGLDGQDIPMGARLFSIVDAYVAMILPSYERPCKNKQDVIREFSAMSGEQFDPFLVQMLIDIISDDSFSDLVEDYVPG